MRHILIVLASTIILSAVGCGDDKPLDNNIPEEEGFEIVFNTSAGGDGWEIGEDIAAIPSGGYIVTGWTDSYGLGRNDLYLIRVDALGNIVWESNFGGTGSNSDDHGDGVTLTADGNILAVGYTNSFNSREETYIVKVNMDGELIWENQVGLSFHDTHAKVVSLSDGYFIGGNAGSNYNCFVRKIDLDGNLLWDSVYNETGDFFDMAATSDGGLVLAGDFLFKIDGSGVVQWSDPSLGDLSDDSTEVLYSVIEASDGSILASGYQGVNSTNPEFYEQRVYVAKYNQSGSLQWSSDYNIDGRGYILENDDGTFSVSSSTYETGEIFINKIDPDGELLSSFATGVSGYPWQFKQGSVGIVVTGSATVTTDPGDVLIAEFKEK